MVKANIELVDSGPSIERKVIRALRKEVDKFVIRATHQITAPIRNIVKNAILEQPETQSLDGGQLAGEFGFRDGRERVKQIVDIWTNNIMIIPRKATIFKVDSD